ncbi:MAG: ABC transporter substrate-binding protein [Halobaculum sp.]
MSEQDTGRRTFLAAAGSAAAAAMAGCTGDTGGTATGTATDEATGTPTPTDEGTPTPTPQPETREGYLQAANKFAHDEAPWIFLNRQFSVYGKSNDINWQARVDERIDGYGIEPATDSGDDVVITQSSLDSGLDPQDHRETPTDNIVTQAYEGLYERDREGKIIPKLATDFQRVETGHHRFTIRDGVSFHSGDSLQPDDVAYSINRIVNPDVGIKSPQKDQLSGIDGAEVASTDDRTVDVFSRTKEGDLTVNPIVFSLFGSYCDVMNKSWVQDHERSYINTHMEGTGPFTLSNYEQGVSVEFQAYSDYWDEEAAISTLTFTAAKEASTRVSRLLGGEADIIVNVPPQDVSRVEQNSGTSISAVPSTRIIFNAMRYDVEPFDDPTFRLAMNYAIDLNSIIQNVLQTFGAPTGQPTLEGFVGYNPDIEIYPQDQERAQQMVEESGYAGAEITLHTPVGRYLKDVSIAQAVAEQVDQLENVSAEVKQREFSALASEILTGKIKDKPHWYLIGWGNSTFDASQTLIPLLTSGGALTTYKNDQFDKLVDKAQNLPGGGGGGSSDSGGDY